MYASHSDHESFLDGMTLRPSCWRMSSKMPKVVLPTACNRWSRDKVLFFAVVLCSKVSSIQLQPPKLSSRSFYLAHFWIAECDFSSQLQPVAARASHLGKWELSEMGTPHQKEHWNTCSLCSEFYLHDTSEFMCIHFAKSIIWDHDVARIPAPKPVARRCSCSALTPAVNVLKHL